MAVKIPLVLTNSLIQQLQAGDTIIATDATRESFAATNGEGAASLVIGTPVYISAAATAKQAKADAMATAGVVGLWLSISTAPAGSGSYVISGTLVATTAQWDVITGAVGGLTPNSLYFLDPSTAGKLTTTAPSTPGQVVIICGRATSTTDMEVLRRDPILL